MRARMPYADGDRIPIAALPTRPQNAKELAELAERMGIVMSERTAHRIVRGQIAPLVNVAAHVLGPQRAQVSARALDAQRRLDLSSDDEQDFARALRSAFSLLEERYYIALTDDPTIRMTGGKVTVSFDFADQD